MDWKPSSLDIARCIRCFALMQYNVKFNTTKVNCLLYLAYAFYLVLNESPASPLRDADAPLAYFLGPTFPYAYKWLVADDFSIEPKVSRRVAQDALWAEIIPFVVKRYFGYTTPELVRMGHRAGGPWHETVFGKNAAGETPRWGIPIDNQLILDYYSPQN